MSRELRAILCSLALLLFLCAPASALEPWRLLARIHGQVQSASAGQGDWSPIWRSRLLSDGDRARTLQNSRAQIELADQSVFTIGSDSTATMEKFQLTPHGRVVLFNLEVGRIRARVAKLLTPGSRFVVTTANGAMAARGTDFYVEQTAPGLTYLLVFAGRVDAATRVQHRAFFGGDYGVIGADGRIRFDPPDLVPGKLGPLGSQGPDGDMRTPDADEAGAFGIPAGNGPPGSVTSPPIFSPGSTAPVFGSPPSHSAPPSSPPASGPPGR